MRQGLKKAKAEQAARRRRAKKRKRALVLMVEVFVLGVLLCVGYVMNKYGKFQIHMFNADDVKQSDDANDEGFTTVALFGSDSRDGSLGEGTHADTIMIASINKKTKQVKLVSVYRDLLTKQQNGEMGKANSAYFNGGPKDAVNMLNQNLDLAIQDYVTVDFAAFASVVDLLGGIEVNISVAEAEEINNYIQESADVVGKKAKPVQSGNQVLDGVQTVTYARIRKNVGGDYARTERQQYVIKELVKKVKKTNLSTINEMIDTIFSKISTSFTLTEMLSLASDLFKYEFGESKSFAFEYTDGTVESVGSVVIPLGFSENVKELHEFLYPTQDYDVSNAVKEISTEIETLTGKTREHFNETEVIGTPEE